MQVPTGRLFTAGDTLSGAVMNQTVTSFSNFFMGKPIGQFRASGTQTAWASGVAVVLFDTEDIDRDNAHLLTPAADTGKYTAKTPGWYRVNGQAFFAGNTTGNSRYVYFRKNGSTIVTASQSRYQATTPPGGAVAVQTAPAVVYLNGTTDYVELIAGHDATSSIGLAAPLSGQGVSMMYVEWVSL